MRALIVLLLLLASMASARETILSGDSDHTILPSGDVTADHTREVMLFKNSMLANAGATHDVRWYSWWTNDVPLNDYLRCLPMRGHDADQMSVNPGDCDAATHHWTTNRSVTITRTAVVLHKPWFYRPASEGGAGGTWNDCRYRFVSIDTAGTVVAITSEKQWPADSSDADGYSSATAKLSAGESVGIQLRRPGETGVGTCIAEDPNTINGMIGEIQIWGVYN